MCSNDINIEYYRKKKNIPIWYRILFLIYIILSYYEIYLIPYIGNSTKILIFILVVSFVIINNKLLANENIYFMRNNNFIGINEKIQNKDLGVAFILWFCFLCISTIWSSHYNESFRMYFLTILGNVVLIFIIGCEIYDESFIRYILKGHYWVSFSFGIFSVLFHQSYISELFVTRQVLTIFGQQNDPNNCCAFLLIGISLALYSMIYEKANIIIDIFVVVINGYAVLLTSSRSGVISIGFITVIFLILPSHIINSNMKKYLLIILGIGLIIIIGIKILPEENINRILAFDSYSDGSGRNELWRYAMELIRQRPLLGWGWGGYYYPGVGLHNTYISIWCDCGLIGLLLFLIPIISMCIQAIKNKNFLIIIILISGLLPSFFFDAINKRFFWNSIVLSTILLSNTKINGEKIRIW